MRAILAAGTAAMTLSVAPTAQANGAGEANAVVRQFISAARAGSGSRACRLMDRHFQRAVIRGAMSNGLPATDCPTAETQILNLLNRALGHMYIIKTVTHRGHATVTVGNHVLPGSGHDLLILVRMGKHWRLHGDIG